MSAKCFKWLLVKPISELKEDANKQMNSIFFLEKKVRDTEGKNSAKWMRRKYRLKSNAEEYFSSIHLTKLEKEIRDGRQGKVLLHLNINKTKINKHDHKIQGFWNIIKRPI